jgi:hypothetical protein
MAFQPPPDGPGTPPPVSSTEPVVPNVLSDPAVPGETPPPKRGPRAAIVGAIAVVAALVAGIGGKLLLGLLATSVAGAALSAVFGGPWDKLPSDVRNRYEDRLEAAVGSRLDGLSKEQQATQVEAWLHSGYVRLDDTRLVRHLELEVDALSKTDVSGCASFGRSSITGKRIDDDTSDKLVGALDQASMVEFLGMNVDAIEAELRGAPPPLHVTDVQTSPILQQMLTGLNPAEIQTLANLNAGQSATDAEVCTAIRSLYRQALALDPGSKAILARLDVDAQ